MGTQKVPTVKQPTHLGTRKGSAQAWTKPELFSSPKEVAGKREGDGYIQPRDYHKNPFTYVNEKGAL